MGALVTDVRELGPTPNLMTQGGALCQNTAAHKTPHLSLSLVTVLALVVLAASSYRYIYTINTSVCVSYQMVFDMPARSASDSCGPQTPHGYYTHESRLTTNNRVQQQGEH